MPGCTNETYREPKVAREKFKTAGRFARRCSVGRRVPMTAREAAPAIFIARYFGPSELPAPHRAESGPRSARSAAKPSCR
jgi:hypothetical protein